MGTNGEIFQLLIRFPLLNLSSEYPGPCTKNCCSILIPRKENFGIPHNGARSQQGRKAITKGWRREHAPSDGPPTKRGTNRTDQGWETVYWEKSKDGGDWESEGRDTVTGRNSVSDLGEGGYCLNPEYGSKTRLSPNLRSLHGVSPPPVKKMFSPEALAKYAQVL